MLTFTALDSTAKEGYFYSILFFLTKQFYNEGVAGITLGTSHFEMTSMLTPKAPPPPRPEIGDLLIQC